MASKINNNDYLFYLAAIAGLTHIHAETRLQATRKHSSMFNGTSGKSSASRVFVFKKEVYCLLT